MTHLTRYIGEIPAINLNIRWVLLKLKTRHTTLFAINNVVLLVGWVVIRVVGYVHMKNGAPPAPCVCMCSQM